MPTRLLDWTSNALGALWFVVTNKNLSNNGNKDGVVWMLSFTDQDRRDDNLRPFEISKPEILRPRHVEKRLVAQGGWFTIHPDNKPLDQDKTFQNRLKQILIPYKHFDDIRFMLNLCGLNQVTLFPELDGLCKHIAYQNSKEYTERRDRERNIQ